jgi:hypothetical protein
MQSAATLIGGNRASMQALSSKRTSQIRAKATGLKVVAAGPPPAWPGRAPVPDTIAQRSGPKARKIQEYCD